jgi:hypothetical protein
MQNYFKAGTWNAICSICGKLVKSDQIVKRWDGLLVCRDDFEVRHSLDFIRARPEKGNVPFTAPEPEDTFVSVICPYPTQFAMADIGTADCSMADRVYDRLIIIPIPSPAIANIAIANIHFAALGT